MTASRDTKQRVALVTGATKGIGHSIARELSRRDLYVIAAGRDTAAGEKLAVELGGPAKNARFEVLDVTSLDSIDAMVANVERAGGLDVLVNNAGASFDGFDAQVARRTLDVNFTGMMLLTDRIMPFVHEGGRIVMVSSGMGAISSLSPALQKEVMSDALDREALIAFTDRFVSEVAAKTHANAGWPSNAYRVSKIAMNAYVRILARELAGDPRKILVNAVDPGWVRTAMGGSSAPRSPAEGAKTPVWLATLPSGDDRTGGFYRDEHAVAW